MLQGNNQQAIADRLHVSHVTIYNDIKFLTNKSKQLPAAAPINNWYKFVSRGLPSIVDQLVMIYFSVDYHPGIFFENLRARVQDL